MWSCTHLREEVARVRLAVTVAVDVADAFIECQHLVDRVVDALLQWRSGRAQRPVDVTAQTQISRHVRPIINCLVGRSNVTPMLVLRQVFIGLVRHRKLLLVITLAATPN